MPSLPHALMLAPLVKSQREKIALLPFSAIKCRVSSEDGQRVGVVVVYVEPAINPAASTKINTRYKKRRDTYITPPRSDARCSHVEASQT